MTRILIATDAWRPQVNGVVRTYENLAAHIAALGVELTFLTPDEFRCVPCPTYPEIRLALPGFAHVADRIASSHCDFIHIATEGPIGWMTRAHCLKRGRPFTTSFHTRYAEYVTARFGVPESWTYALQRRFHNSAAGVLISSDSIAKDLTQRGFERLLPWTRGVDTELFCPRPERLFGQAPVFLYVGRVAVEKNIESFLRLDLPGRKVVVGDGPLLASLRAQYPDVQFTGARFGEDLARCYASADVFVFPSRTDTFGVVLLEAMASGVPVAAYPVPGPIDNVPSGIAGVLDENLRQACLAALRLDRTAVRRHALSFSWETTARMFVQGIEYAVTGRTTAVERTKRAMTRHLQGRKLGSKTA